MGRTIKAEKTSFGRNRAAVVANFRNSAGSMKDRRAVRGGSKAQEIQEIQDSWGESMEFNETDNSSFWEE